jgi:hypothetical protein
MNTEGARAERWTERFDGPPQPALCGHSITTKLTRGNATALAIESMMLIWHV